MVAETTDPRGRRLSDVEAAALLRKVEQVIADGASVVEACRGAGISPPTFYRWKERYGEELSNTDRVRVRIIQAAKRIFFRVGYQATLESVAAEAEVARQTLYNQFGSKHDLFAEVIREVYTRLYRGVPLRPTADLRATLADFGRAYVGIVLDPESIALQRIAIGGYLADPALARVSHDLRQSNIVPTFANWVADYFAGQMETGALRRSDPLVLAESFFAACAGSMRNRALTGVETFAATEIDARVALAVDIFANWLQPAVVKACVPRA